MAKQNEKFSSWNFVWAIIDITVNILTMIAVILLLSDKVGGWLLTFIIIIFILWAFRPMYLTFKEFIEKFPKKKIPPNKLNLILFLTTLYHYLLFLLSIIVFASVVMYLGQLVHPLIISSSIIISSGLIVLYDHFRKIEKRSSLKILTLFFYFTSLVLFVFVLFFLTYDLQKGINLEPQNINFNVYIVNNALNVNEVQKALDYNTLLWSDYNLTIGYNLIDYKEVNLSSEEVLFLFDNGTASDDCIDYNKIINKIKENKSDNLSIIFLKNINSKHAGRGCICNCSFALVSPEKFWIFDFTGWNVAHEIGHILGLTDIQYYGRIKENLMNDETKKLFFFKSDFLYQTQLDNVINKSKSLNQMNNFTS